MTCPNLHNKWVVELQIQAAELQTLLTMAVLLPESQCHPQKRECGWPLLDWVCIPLQSALARGWWVNLSRTTWHKKNYKACLRAGKESVFTDWGSGIGQIPQSLPLASIRMLMFSERSHGIYSNAELKVIKICQAQRIFMDVIIFKEATLYVTGYFTFFLEFSRDGDFKFPAWHFSQAPAVWEFFP